MPVRFRAARRHSPPLEFHVWRVTKGALRAEALVRLTVRGRELRVMVNDELMFSHLFAGDDDGRRLGEQSTGTLQSFLGQGWALSPDSDVVCQ